MTKVVHCKQEPFDVYIGRPSKWGNPFSHLTATTAEFKVNSREEAIRKYSQWIITQPQINDIEELRDKTLGCWCKPKACHGDILVALLEFDITKL